MKTLSRISLIIFLTAVVYSVSGQDAKSSLDRLYSKYSDIPNYSVSVNYVAENEAMGFRNEQSGGLAVVGEKYKLTYGPNETWMSDGKAEYLGTKEEDHSELLIFCPGENFESPINHGKLFVFYGSGVDASMEGDMIKVVPKDGSYKYAKIDASGNTIRKIVVLDEFNMSHIYTFSGFSTNTDDVEFTIDASDYADTIDERQGCK